MEHCRRIITTDSLLLAVFDYLVKVSKRIARAREDYAAVTFGSMIQDGLSGLEQIKVKEICCKGIMSFEATSI